MADHYSPQAVRPTPPSPWTPLLFIAVLGGIWILPSRLQFEPVQVWEGPSQLRVLLSWLVAATLLFCLLWVYAPAQHTGQLQYPHSKQTRRSENFSAPYSFVWACLMVLTLLLLLHGTVEGRVADELAG